MSNISQFGGGAIKSIQRGTINATTGGATATISSVNTSKTELRFLGGGYFNASGAPVFPRVVLTNSTTITATASDTPNGNCTVSWELTEFY